MPTMSIERILHTINVEVKVIQGEMEEFAGLALNKAERTLLPPSGW